MKTIYGICSLIVFFVFLIHMIDSNNFSLFSKEYWTTGFIVIGIIFPFSLIGVILLFGCIYIFQSIFGK